MLKNYRKNHRVIVPKIEQKIGAQQENIDHLLNK
jgi:hypothetical protein